MYDSSRTLFQQQVSTILKKDQHIPSLFGDIFKFIQLKELERKNVENDINNWKSLLTLYRELGMSTFVKVISILGNKTISFPKEEDMEEDIITVLCYYYVHVEGKSWDKIKEKLCMPSLNTIKYGIRINQLQKFIDRQTLSYMTRTWKKQEDKNE